MSRGVFKVGQKVRFNGLNSEADFTGCSSKVTTCSDNSYSDLKIGGVYTIETIRGYMTMTDDIRLVGHNKTVEACWFSAVKEEPKVKREPFVKGQKVRFIGMDEQPILGEGQEVWDGTARYRGYMSKLVKGAVYTVNVNELLVPNKFTDDLFLTDAPYGVNAVEACWFTPEYDYESLLVYCLTGKHPHA